MALTVWFAFVFAIDGFLTSRVATNRVYLTPLLVPGMFQPPSQPL